MMVVDVLPCDRAHRNEAFGLFGQLPRGADEQGASIATKYEGATGEIGGEAEPFRPGAVEGVEQMLHHAFFCSLTGRARSRVVASRMQASAPMPMKAAPEVQP